MSSPVETAGPAGNAPSGEVADRPAPPGSPGATWACFAASLAGFLALIAYVVAVNPPLWWDETWYLEDVPLLHRLGLSAAWLVSLKGPAGPLFGLVHAAFEPLTGLRPPAVRLVSIGFAALTVLALGAALRSRRVPRPFPKAAALLAVPFLYTSTGSAVTEMPAMFFLCAGLALLLPAIERARSGERAAYTLAILAGLACGVATAGRQPFLVVLLASIALLRPRTWPVGLLFALAGLAVFGPLFLLWGGMVPPTTQAGERGLSIAHCLAAFGYAGVIYCLFNVDWLLRRPVDFVGIVAAVVAANVATGFFEHCPMYMTAIRYLSPSGLRVFARVASGVMLGFGAAFLAELVRLGWERRGDPAELYICAATVLVLLATIKHVRIMPGRYIASSIPLMILMTAGRAPDTYGKAARLAVGCAFGMVSLVSCFKSF